MTCAHMIISPIRYSKHHIGIAGFSVTDMLKRQDTTRGERYVD